MPTSATELVEIEIDPEDVARINAVLARLSPADRSAFERVAAAVGQGPRHAPSPDEKQGYWNRLSAALEQNKVKIQDLINSISQRIPPGLGMAVAMILLEAAVAHGAKRLKISVPKNAVAKLMEALAEIRAKSL
jgi:hypothetical protein